MEKKVVTVIEPSVQKAITGKQVLFKKRRVCGYARVSTDMEEQTTSYETQVEYYTNYIKQNPEWEFVGLYSDEGITGTSTKKRDGFNKMIADALAGKIDLIITKSVSRFARNTVDALTTIRKLKEKNVEVYFEKENTYTLDGKGEFMIGLLSSLAQEESRSISENTVWGKRKGFQEGKYSMAYSQFLGYDKGDDGKLKVNKEQAKIIKFIYKLYLLGNSTRDIKKELERQKIKTPTGKNKWYVSTILSELKNEKYVGDVLIQKYYSSDFLTKKLKVNNGVLPKYFIENEHEAIVDRRTYNVVQDEIKHRIKSKCKVYCGKIICGECGEIMTRKIWHSNDKYRVVMYTCKGRHGLNNSNIHIKESDIKAKFVDALQVLIERKYDALDNIKIIKEVVCDTSNEFAEKSKIESEMKEIESKANALIKSNTKTSQNQKKYEEKYKALCDQYENTKTKLNEVLIVIEEKKHKGIQIDNYQKELSKTKIAKWDSRLWVALVDKMVVGKYKVEVHFKDGTVV